MLVIEASGTVILADEITFPRRPFGFIPLIVVGRSSVNLSSVEHVYVHRRWLFMQRISLSSYDKRVLMFFGSRTSRVEFIRQLSERNPLISIYRG